MFDELVLPLRRDRHIDITYEHTDETATAYRRARIVFENIDIILLKGIFLFKPQYIGHFDLRIWVECSFETALERAVNRCQEGLSRENTVGAYRSIYFPAQRLHLERDHPKELAGIVLLND
jgi:uridine kinase